MLTRKVFLLSAAIPLASLPMTVSGYARTQAPHTHIATGSSFLVAQSDTDQELKEKLKKRREEKKTRQGAEKHDQKQGTKDKSQAEQLKDKQAEHPKEKRKENNAAPPPKATHEGKSRTEQRDKAPPKPDANQQSATDKEKPKAQKAEPEAQKAKPEAQKEKPDEQQAAPQKDKPRERKATKPDETPSKAEQAPAVPSKDKNVGSDKSTPDQSAEKPKKPEQRDHTGKKAQEERNQANEQQSKQPETAAPAEKGKQPSSDEQADKSAPLPDQPTSNAAAAPRKDDEKPQRLNLQNGAAVFDSEKNVDRKHRTNGRRDKQEQRNQPQQNDQQQDARDEKPRKPVRVRSAEAEDGEAINHAPQFHLPQDAKVEKRTNNRVILNIDNRTIIQNNDHGRLTRNARDVSYERLPDGNFRQVVVRPNGVRIVTIRNSYGDIVHRSRIGRNGREVVLIYAPEGDRHDRSFYRQPYVDLPPLHLTEPVDHYILEARQADTAQYIRFLEKPPIEPVRDVYTLDQVRYSARLRDVMPRIDLDTITFDTGSSAIGPNAASALGDLAQAIKAVLRRDAGQIFLIEGHTDAVGSEQSNLVLSDERAESVARLLTRDFDVPPENLVTQGYGEEYLKVNTQGPERANRRVTVRRITPLVRPVVQNE